MNKTHSLRRPLLLTCCASFLVAKLAFADEPQLKTQATEQRTENTTQAADLYDQGTQLYTAGQYSQAAQKFLAADGLVPSSDALLSAMASSRKAEDHLLTVRAALRAIGREEVDPVLAVRARAALEEAQQHLARLTIQCAPAPCTVFVDEQPLLDAKAYLLPGTHVVKAQYSSDPRSSVQKTLTLGSGLEYNELLTPPPQTRSPAEAPQMAAATTASPQSDSSESGKLPRWAFYSGVAVTGALVAVTIWSGVDTLNAKDGLPSRRDPGYAAAVDDVHGSARRTDWLLGGSFAAAAATAIVGIWDTDWNHSSAPRVGLAPGKTGAQLRIQGGFW